MLSSPLGNQSFGRKRRLGDKASFTRVLGSSVRVQSGSLALLMVRNEEGMGRLGVAVAKRLVTRAVDRNRVKRMMREAFRRHLLKLQPVDLFISVRARAAGNGDAASRAATRADIASLLEKAASRVIK